MSNEPAPFRVLIVDDEPLLCWALADVLAERGDQVIEAASGEEAVRQLDGPPEPDVVLLDLELPDSHDLKLLSTIKGLAPHSRVILMSAWCTKEMAEQAMALGAFRVVHKPIDMQDIPALVHGDRPVGDTKEARR